MLPCGFLCPDYHSVESTFKVIHHLSEEFRWSPHTLSFIVCSQMLNAGYLDSHECALKTD